jgi:hypothetical protein
MPQRSAVVHPRKQKSRASSYGERRLTIGNYSKIAMDPDRQLFPAIRPLLLQSPRALLDDRAFVIRRSHEQLLRHTLDFVREGVM